MRFHVLGIGAIGTLVSHHLRHTTASPISLIFKRAHALRRTADPEQGDDRPPPFGLSVRRGPQVSKSTGFDVEKIHDGRDHHHAAAQLMPGARNGRIDSLIVCLKTVDTLPALRILSPRLSPTSVITLLQNGMGVYDELCASIFPDPAKRPHFVLGTTTHGVTRLGHNPANAIKHVSRPGEGELKFGVVPDPRGQLDLDRWLWSGEDASSQHITTPPASPRLPLTPPPISSAMNLHETLNTLLSMSELSPSLMPMPHLHHQLLLKLAINSVVNPLTAILGLGALPNGALIDATSGYLLISLICAETSAILTAYTRSLSDPYPPSDDILRLFSPSVLEARCRQVIHETATNTSSMAADISNGRKPEIDNINGYLLSLASRLNVPAPTHKMLVQMVKFVSSMSRGSPPSSAAISASATSPVDNDTSVPAHEPPSKEAVAASNQALRRIKYAEALSSIRTRISDEAEHIMAEKRDASEQQRADNKAKDVEAQTRLFALKLEAARVAQTNRRAAGKSREAVMKRHLAFQARRLEHKVEKRQARKMERLAKEEESRQTRAGAVARDGLVGEQSPTAEGGRSDRG